MTTLLVDGNNILARSAFAAKGGRTQMSVGGVNTSALLIFINMLSKYVRQVQPTHMAVCWDAGHALRDAIYPEYKANRNKAVVEEDEEVVTPWAQAKEFLTWAGVPHLARKGWEADDLIAKIVHETPPAHRPIVILSGDKDLLQLVDEVTTQIRPGTHANEVWDEDRVDEEIGVLPQHIPLYMALTGDTGDNVPGVRGVGPKKAVKALQEAGWDWDALLDALGPEKAKEAVLSRRLVDLRYPEFTAYGDALDGVLLNLSAPAFTPTATTGMLWEPLLDFLKKWQMNSVIQRLNDGSLWYEGGSTDSTAEAFVGFDV